MARERNGRTHRRMRHISILNWMGTLILCSIPGVNLLALIGMLIWAKSPSKKNFAWAVLILTLLAVAAYIALAVWQPRLLSDAANRLRELSARSPADAGILPTPEPTPVP